MVAKMVPLGKTCKKCMLKKQVELLLFCNSTKRIMKTHLWCQQLWGMVALTVATIAARNILVVNGCKYGASWQDMQEMHVREAGGIIIIL